ncbi:MAG TPA: hypothetical protein VGM03_02355 [Phycisphaerae bacterium]
MWIIACLAGGTLGAGAIRANAQTIEIAVTEQVYFRWLGSETIVVFTGKTSGSAVDFGFCGLGGPWVIQQVVVINHGLPALVLDVLVIGHSEPVAPGTRIILNGPPLCDLVVFTNDSGEVLQRMSMAGDIQ